MWWGRSAFSLTKRTSYPNTSKFLRPEYWTLCEVIFDFSFIVYLKPTLRSPFQTRRPLPSPCVFSWHFCNNIPYTRHTETRTQKLSRCVCLVDPAQRIRLKTETQSIYPVTMTQKGWRMSSRTTKTSEVVLSFSLVSVCTMALRIKSFWWLSPFQVPEFLRARNVFHSELCSRIPDKKPLLAAISWLPNGQYCCNVMTSTLTAYLTCMQPQYTKVKVPSTQDKQHISWAALQSYAAAATL